MTSETENKPKAKKPSPGAWIAVGVAVGVALGVVFKQLALGIALGTAIGAAMDFAAHRRNKNQQ